MICCFVFFFSSRRRHTRWPRDWSSDVCSSDLVRRRLPRVSLATVYRNLRMLAAEGFLAERADEAGLRFDGNTGRHDHFTCLACRRIFDVPARVEQGARRRLAARIGFEVLD